MTIIDLIIREAEALPPRHRQEALKALRIIRVRTELRASVKAPARKTLGKARAAINAARGMWRDRTDLPRDTIEASLELRRRVMKRD
jgi:hypothetical protein